MSSTDSQIVIDTICDNIDEGSTSIILLGHSNEELNILEIMMTGVSEILSDGLF